jgi:hypothetical protein
MTNPAVPDNTNLVVKNSAHFTTTIKIKAFTMVKNAAMNLDIRVCGVETLTLADSNK